MRTPHLLLALALAAVALPPSDAHGTCPHQVYHTYGLGLSAGAYSSTVRTGNDGGTVVVWDTNLADCDGDGIPADFDGDLDAGLGGGFFGYGTWATTCDLHPRGPTVTVNDIVFGNGIAFVIGEDGPSVGKSRTLGTDAETFLWVVDYFGYPASAEGGDDVTTFCQTNGIIAPQVDVGDCLSTVFHGTGTTCGSGGGDGGYWVFLLSPEVSENGNGVFVSNPPTTGTITAT